MKHSWVPVLIGLVVLAACSTQPPNGGAASTSTPSLSAASAGHVLRATLENGLKVVIVRDAFAPVATQQITYFAGSNQSPEGFPGRAHAQEHMMFRGSPGLTKNQLGQITARLGNNSNAYTSANFTSYYYTVSSADLGVVLHIGALRMAGVNDDEEEWKDERGAIEQEVARDHSNPSRMLLDKLKAHIFAGTPYARDGVGRRASFDKTTAKMLKVFYDKWYAPNNALLVVTGDVEPDAVLTKIKKLYGRIQAKDIPVKPEVTFAPVQATTLRTETDQTNGYVELAFRMPGYRSSYYPAASIASTVLGSPRGPIATLGFEGKVLSAGFSHSAWTDTGIGYVWATFAPGRDPKTVKKVLVDAVHGVLDNGVNPGLIAAAKRRVALSRQLKRNSIHGLANAWTWAVARVGVSSPDAWGKHLLAVTPGEVNSQVDRILDLDHAVTLIAEPKPGATPSHNQNSGTTESFSTHPGGSVTLPDWAEAAFAKLPQPKPFLHPADMSLPNGLRLVVQPLKVSHSVILLGAIHHDSALQTPDGQMGVSGLLGNLFAWGPEGMSRLQFEAAQDKLGISLSAGFGFSLKALPGKFDEGVRLLSKTLLDPALPAKAFKNRKKVLVKYYKGRVDSPRYKLARAYWEALLPKGDPALRHATAKSVAGLNLGEIEAYYKKTFRPDETTIVVLGDITPARAKKVVEKYFGAWKVKNPEPNLELPPVPPSGATHVFVPDSSRVQNKVYLAETLKLDNRNPAHFAFDLLNSYLGGGLYGNPLMRELRIKRGLVYGAYAGADFSRTRGRFSLFFGSDPDKYKEARKISIKVLENIREKPLSRHKLHLVKSSALRRLELAQQSVHAIGSGWLSRSTSDLPLDWNYVQARHYQKLTASDIKRIFKKYFDPSRLATFVLGPPNQ